MPPRCLEHQPEERAWPVVSAMSDTINRMQTVELGVARDLVARAQVLQRGAERAALFTGILTAAILILVLIATFAVARSLVLPLRRLREGALDIADGATAGAGPATRRDPGLCYEPGRGADRRDVRG